jgi:prevent-host-death family protein
MSETVSKSRFKARALEYFRRVQQSGRPLIVTDRGRPVLKIVPYSSDPDDPLSFLRGSGLEYKDPTEPVGLGDWSVLR